MLGPESVASFLQRPPAQPYIAAMCGCRESCQEAGMMTQRLLPMPGETRLRGANLGARRAAACCRTREAKPDEAASCHEWAPAETTHLTPQTLRHCARRPRCMLRLRWRRDRGTLHASRHLSVSHPYAVLCGIARPPWPCAPAAQLWAVGQARGAPGAFADAAAAWL